MIQIKLPNSNTNYTSISELKSYISLLCDFIKEHQFVYDYNFIDFYIEEPYFPPEWLSLSFNTEELISLVDGTYPSNTDLMIYFKECREISLSRDYQPFTSKEEELIPKKELTKLSMEANLKKKNELQYLSNFFSFFFENYPHLRNESIWDIGCGKGYLSMLLAYGFKLNVRAVDLRKEYLQSAEIRRQRIVQRLKQEGNLEWVQEDFLKASNKNKEGMMIGLHACGDVSANMIKLFKSLPKLHTLFSIGCCYNLLTESECDSTNCYDCRNNTDTSNSSEPGFPMSQFLINQKFSLGLTARLVGSQAVEKWGTSHSVQHCEFMFKKHHYRCLLQILLRNHSKYRNDEILWKKEKEKYIVGKLKNGHFETFKKYAQTCFDKFGLELEMSDDELEVFEQKYKDKKKRLDLAVTLRAALGSVIESLILSDRVLYLSEETLNLDIRLLPVFDVLHSPRNMLLFAHRPLLEKEE